MLNNPRRIGTSWVKGTWNYGVPACMRTSATLIAFVLVFLLCSTASRAEDFCPASVVTEQHAVTVPKNYQAFKDSDIDDPLDPNRLYMVQVFDGKPSSLGSIRPDQFKNNMLIWNLRNLEPNAVFWINCYYTDTEINLAEKLPSNLSSCAVSYVDAKHAFLQGMPIIKSVECQ
jgi:hypothetical protein